MRKTLIIAGALAAVTVAGSGAAMASSGNAEATDEAAYTSAHRSEAATSQEAATATATALHAGKVVDTHLQNEGTFVWELVIDDGTTRSEVQVDAASGKVVSDQPDE